MALIKATKPLVYAGQTYTAESQPFEAKDRDAKILVALKKAN